MLTAALVKVRVAESWSWPFTSIRYRG